MIEIIALIVAGVSSATSVYAIVRGNRLVKEASSDLASLQEKFAEKTRFIIGLNKTDLNMLDDRFTAMQAVALTNKVHYHPHTLGEDQAPSFANWPVYYCGVDGVLVDAKIINWLNKQRFVYTVCPKTDACSLFFARSDEAILFRSWLMNGGAA